MRGDLLIMDFVSLRDKLHELDSATWKAIRKAAKEGNAEAQFLLGYRVSYGRFSARGCKKWLTAAAAQDHPEAVRLLAQIDFEASPLTWGTQVYTEERRELLTRAAELGSPGAQRDLAVCFVWGEPPFEQDWAMARYWYYRAAQLGHQESQIAVGSMMIQGDGGPLNVTEGLELIETAAAGPDLTCARDAARHLADLYKGGRGLEHNPEKAAEWKKRSEALRQASSDPQD